MRRLKDSELDQLSDALSGFGNAAPSDEEDARRAFDRYEQGWRPDLGPTQLLVFNNDTAKYILCDGERGSGKSWVLLHKLVKHCLLAKNATAAIITRESAQSKDGGAWDKLITDILPIWSREIGLVHTPPKYDVETHKPYLWIVNKYGSGSMVRCISLQHGEHVSDKIKGREYTFVLFDEAQATADDADTYFSAISQQIGRKAGVDVVQQFCLSANPKGTKHWLYKRFFEYPIDPDTKEWNHDYARYHVPISENVDRLPEGYYDRVLEAVRGDPIETARMVRGEWVDAPTGRAIFKGIFFPDIHVKGNLLDCTGLVPVEGKTIIASYDLGPAHSSIHFSQFLVTRFKSIWIVFDELNFVGQYLPYRLIVPILVGRMKYWESASSTKAFSWDHISDTSAFNQARTDGSFDVTTVMEEAEKLGRNISMRPAPKGPNSIAERTRMLQDMLRNEEIYVSAICTKTIDMLTFIESKKEGREYEADLALKPAKSPHVHSFDSLTYGIITVRVSGVVPTTIGSKGSGIVRLGGV